MAKHEVYNPKISYFVDGKEITLEEAREHLRKKFSGKGGKRDGFNSK